VSEYRVMGSCHARLTPETVRCVSRTPNRPILMKKPAAPKGLSDEARKLWRSICSDFEMDASGLALLAEACYSLDRLRQAQALIRNEGITVQDRFQQPKQHPATLIERDARNQFVKCLKALNLDVEAGQVGAPLARI
jgi:P27 family predicted phage terminase small subunit